MALLKIALTPAMFAKLDEVLRQKGNQFELVETTQEGEKRVNFVDIVPGNRKFDGHHIEIALALMEEREVCQDGKINFVPINREMLDRLLDFLGEFPEETEVERPTLRDLRTAIQYLEEIQTLPYQIFGRDEREPLPDAMARLHRINHCAVQALLALGVRMGRA